MSKFTKVAPIIPEENPLFQRLFGAEGFKILREEGEDGVDAFLAAPGLKFAIFADDPNKQKETMDIVVIGPELAKVFPNLAEKRMSDVTTGRALAARWGIRKLPAVALFRGGVYLGAAEGLMGWSEYIEALAEISRREAAPKRTIAIMAKPAPAES